MGKAKRRAAPPADPALPTIRPPVIAVTSGEPAGIGPDVCLALADRAFDARVVVLGDRAVLAARAARLDRDVPLADFDAARAPSPGALEVLHRPTAAPVQKSVINDAGIPFTGHTEYLAGRASADVVMMLVGGGLRVALATTHLALADVAREITRAGLERTLRTVEAELRRRFGIARPRILVAGLNPHAGEAGYLGREEIDVIAPVVEKLAREGLAVRGPLPADTLFTPRELRDADCVLAMYHDQGLPVLKHASFGRGVNITLGLPFVRTSVDHGTALDLAGTGKADPSSLFEAVELAVEMAGHERRRA